MMGWFVGGGLWVVGWVFGGKINVPAGCWPGLVTCLFTNYSSLYSYLKNIDFK